ncbi:MAG: SRPBCC domain-containing protein [Gemmatimonadota bacterium]|nr:SRPBCC domain-containing protein [Gemmatimonadota bacterium]
MAFASTTNAQVASATTKRTTFHRETEVRTIIRASDSTVWEILTNADEHPRWNSTVTSITGRIAPRERIVLRSTLDAKRSFKLQVKEFTPCSRLVWADGKGQRTYEIRNNGDGTVAFSMRERIGGFMFPLYAGAIPSFDASFNAFAADLKREAERLEASYHAQ